MFLKVNLKAGRDIEEKQRLATATTYIPYVDKSHWDLADWLYMEDNVLYRSSDGFYIAATLFDLKDKNG